MTQLTNEQLNEIKRDFCEIIVDNMDTKTLVQIVYDNLLFDYKQYNQHEIREVISEYDEDLYEELVDNVTQQYPKQLNQFGG